jgi:branched-chain amino acid transport system substrate-binding protein
MNLRHRPQRTADLNRGRRSLALLTIAVATASVATACSSSSAGGGSGGSILIGGTSDLSGPFSTNGRGLQSGLQIAVDAVNRQGGINGKKLKLTFLDDAAQVSRGAANGTRLINQHHATVVAGFLLSNVCKAVEPIALTKKVPLICNAADAGQLGNPPSANVFMNGILQQRETQGMYALADKVVKASSPTVAMIGLNSAAIQQLQAGQKAEASKRNWKVGANEVVPLTATDLSAQIAAIASSKPDVVMSNLADATSILLVRGLRAAGYRGPIIGSDSSTIVTPTTTKDSNYYVAAAFSAGDTPGDGYQQFLSDAKAAGIDPSKPFVNRGYEQGLIIAQALRNCSVCTGQKLIDSLDSLELDTKGLTASSVVYSKTEHVGVSKLYAYKWDAGSSKVSLYASDLQTGL